MFTIHALRFCNHQLMEISHIRCFRLSGISNMHWAEEILMLLLKKTMTTTAGATAIAELVLRCRMTSMGKAAVPWAAEEATLLLVVWGSRSNGLFPSTLTMAAAKLLKQAWQTSFLGMSASASAITTQTTTRWLRHMEDRFHSAFTALSPSILLYFVFSLY